MNKKLTMSSLEECFKSGKQLGANFIAVKIQVQGCPKPELIVNPKENFEQKLQYYQNAYTDELVLKTYAGIRIVGFSCGYYLDELEL